MRSDPGCASVLPRRALLLALAALLGASLTATPSSADPAPQVPCVDPRGCPDLIVDASRFAPEIRTRTFKENACAVEEGATEPGTRRLLVFTFSTPNIGAGDLIIGSRELHPEWFEYGWCHAHWHFKEFSDYRLWTPAEFAEYHALREASPDAMARDVLAAAPHLKPVRGDKMGFCAVDVRLYGIGVPKYLFCDAQGISVGWADEYHKGLDGQWIDVTGLARGDYVLETEVNAERFYEESDYANNRAWTTVTL